MLNPTLATLDTALQGNKGTLYLRREDIQHLPMLEAGERERWHGIPHHEILDLVEDQFEARNWKVKNAQFALSRMNQRMSAQFDFHQNNLLPLPSGINARMVLSNSHDSSQSLTIYSAAYVQVCTNGLIAPKGLITLKKRHTLSTTSQLPQLILEAFDTYENLLPTITTDIHSLQRFSLTDQAASFAIVQMVRKDVFPVTWSKPIINEYFEPSAENVQTPDFTAWRLLSAINYVARDATPKQEAEVVHAARKSLFSDLQIPLLTA